MNHDSNRCTGCSACVSICNSGALRMEPDPEGFLFPAKDVNLCEECGLCEKSCYMGFKTAKFPPVEIYGLVHKDADILRTSQSGGVFYAIARAVVLGGGVVFGAAISEGFMVKHICCDNINSLSALQGSKYVQSDVGDTYISAKAYLEKEKTVLYSGTPCQIAGLKNFLGDEQKKLITIDLICHGVASPKLWHDYVEQIKYKYGKYPESVDFRDNTRGWSKHYESFTISGKKYYSNKYALLYYTHGFLRKSCSTCEFSQMSRIGDVSIGDYRGVEKYFPEFLDKRGVSLALVNTEKGMDIIKNIMNEFKYISANSEQCLQPALIEPFPVNQNRERMWSEYKEKGFEFIAQKYGCESIPYRVKRKIRKIFNVG